ncbi:GNAT family N-acetyltransferase [Evansella tamaricis]|uniref:GNAT family N-acetyltransferase n=1 Tax=Evansella tamaricis TaxID=2069301 RepID=A0ABS6JJL4_9BACI|nr:GNAT family N-acetyltransferase [Evansella tamaricis]MBU9713860.1 GNAT family N-acetyltransferase [Evansella tamaricis]
MNIVLTKKTAQQIENAEVDALTSRLSAIQQIEGNPMDVAMRKFGNAMAFSVKNIPGPSFNKVLGITAGEEKYIEEILDFYKKRDIPARFEITPAYSTPELFHYFNERGFFQTDFHSTLYTPELNNNYIDERTTDPFIRIRKLKGNEFDLFADIYTKGFQLPEFLKSGIAKNNEVLYDQDNWTFYLAMVDDNPAGIGVLFTKGSVGSLAASATIPVFRNKGVHQALIRRRLSDALDQGCQTVVAQAKFGSISQNNMERNGLRIAYTKSMMVKN